MFNNCCVETCGSRRKDISFHLFPKNEIGLNKWLECINCERLRRLSFQKLRKLFVCRNHFEKRFFSTSRDRVRLRSDAYPTLFTAYEISSGIPETDALAVKNSGSVETDHQYFKKRTHSDHTYHREPVVLEKLFKTQNIAEEMEADVISSLDSSGNEHEVNKEQIEEPSPSGSEHEVNKKPKEEIEPHIIYSVEKPPPSESGHEVNEKPIEEIEPHIIYSAEKPPSPSESVHEVNKKPIEDKHWKEKSFEKLTENLNPLAKTFLWMQIKHCSKKTNSRRFSEEEKLIAIAIMKQSPKTYSFLKKMFILPSKYTLKKLMIKLNIKPGPDPLILEGLINKVP